MAYIHIAPERLEEARRKQEHIRAWFGFTDASHMYCSMLVMQVYANTDGSYFVVMDGKRVPVTKTGYQHYWIAGVHNEDT